MYTKNKTIWQNSFSSFNILLLLPQLALCNISLLKTIYTILFNSLFFSILHLSFFFLNPKGKFASYISINLGQVVPGTIDGQLQYDKCAPQIRAPFPKAKPGLIFTERS